MQAHACRANKFEKARAFARAFLLGFDVVPLKTLLLDLDDTLIPSSQIYKKALSRALSPRQLRAYRHARSEVKSALPRFHSSAHNRWLYFKRLLERLNEWSPKRHLRLMREYERCLQREIKASYTQLRRHELMLKLSKKFRILLITNETLQTQITKLSALPNIESWCAALVTSEEAGWDKPRLEVFQLAMKRYHLNKKHCLVVGDDPSSEIQIAKKLHLPYALSLEFQKPGTRKSFRKAFTCISCLEELLSR